MRHATKPAPRSPRSAERAAIRHAEAAFAGAVGGELHRRHVEAENAQAAADGDTRESIHATVAEAEQYMLAADRGDISIVLARPNVVPLVSDLENLARRAPRDIRAYLSQKLTAIREWLARTASAVAR